MRSLIIRLVVVVVLAACAFSVHANWQTHWQSPLQASLHCQTADALVWSVKNTAPASYGATQTLFFSRQIEPEHNDRALSIPSGGYRLVVSYAEKAEARSTDAGNTLYPLLNSTHILGTWMRDQASRLVVASPLGVGIPPPCYCGQNVVCKADTPRLSTLTLNQGYHPRATKADMLVHPSPTLLGDAESVRLAQLAEQAMVGVLSFGPTSMTQYLPMFYVIVALCIFIYIVAIAAYFSNGPSLLATNGWIASVFRYRALGLGRPLDPDQAYRAENPTVRADAQVVSKAGRADEEKDRLPVRGDIPPV
jgi:hypothetical protein